MSSPQPTSSMSAHMPVQWKLLLLSCASCAIRTYSLSNVLLIPAQMTMLVNGLLLVYPMIYMFQAAFPYALSNFSKKAINFLEKNQSVVLLIIFIEACGLLILGVWSAIFIIIFSVISMLFLNETIKISWQNLCCALVGGGILAALRKYFSEENRTVEGEKSSTSVPSNSISNVGTVSAIVLGATAATAIASHPSVNGMISNLSSFVDIQIENELEDLFD